MDTMATRTWALRQEHLRALARAMSSPLAAAPAAAAQRAAGRRDEVAVLPLYGTITQHGSVWDFLFGGTSADAYAAAFRQAVAEPSVKAIVLDISSPGGEVYGTDELASVVRGGKNGKPVVAVANSLAASAAYWVASAADEIMVTPGGEIGSIGVYGVHEDWSAAYDQLGVKVTLVSAGEGKTDGSPYEPLSEEARADMQASVARYYGMFTSAVAKGRGVSVEKVRGEWKAKVYGAKEAVSMGMADSVGTLDDAIRRAGSLSRGAFRLGAAAEAVDGLGVELLRRKAARREQGLA